MNDLVALDSKMRSMNLTKLDARAATLSEAATVKRASRVDAPPDRVDEKLESAPSGEYPENFNLARLPAKRPPPPKVP